MSFHALEPFRRAYAVVVASIENGRRWQRGTSKGGASPVIDSWRTIRAAQTFVSPVADTLRKKVYAAFFEVFTYRECARIAL